MARSAEGLKVISANRLDSGAVVWLGADGGWQHRIGAAALFTTEEADAALQRAQAAASGIVEPYLVDVALVEGVPMPLRPREQIRSRGPSVRPDLGMQAGRQQ